MKSHKTKAAKQYSTKDGITAISTTDDLVAAINAEIENVFGGGYDDVVTKTASGSDEFMRFDKAGATVGVYNATGSSTLIKLDIASGQTNETYITHSLTGLYGLTSTDLDDFSINGVKIEDLSIHDTIEEFVDKINGIRRCCFTWDCQHYIGLVFIFTYHVMF